MNGLLVRLVFFLSFFCSALAQWTQVNNGLYTNPRIGAFLTKGNVIFTGTGDNGVYRSIDSGATWVQTNNGINIFYVNALISNGGYFFAGLDYVGIYRSSDNGGSWVQINNGLTNLHIKDFIVKDSYLFAGTYGGGIYRSDDNGANWGQVNNGLTDLGIVSFTVNQNYLFAATGNGVYRSSDYGANWSQMNNGLNNGTFALATSGIYIFAGNGYGVWRSSDNGTTWVKYSTGIPPSVVQTFDVRDGYIFAGGQGGVYRSSDYGANWVQINDGMPGGVFVRAITVCGGYLFIGTNQGQGGGIFRRPLSEVYIPLAPELVSPVNDAIGLSITPVLSWRSTDYAAKYYLQIANDTLFSQLVVNDSTLIDTIKQVSSLVNNHKYYWRVKALNMTSSSPWSVSRCFTTEKACVNITLLNQWNLVSMPVVTSNMHTQTLFPTANSSAFGYVNGYISADTLKAGAGYWLRFPDTLSLSFCGSPVPGGTISIKSGWNIVGAYDKGVLVSAITTTPSSIITSAFFGYTNGYQMSSSLQPGKGYWVRSSQSGVINLPIGLVKNTDNYLQEKIDPSWNHLIITDNAGNNQTLYLSPQSINGYDLPPIPPSPIFDVRFATDRYTESIANGSQEISINSGEYPVALKAIGTDFTIKDVVSGRLFNRTVRNGETAIITNPAIKKLKISSIVAPKEFALYQNYPNPFNPSTTINFQVPVTAQVTLKVFDVLGNEVITIVNEVKQAGSYDVTFNGAGLSSGVYFYQLKARNFIDTKKLTLIK